MHKTNTEDNYKHMVCGTLWPSLIDTDFATMGVSIGSGSKVLMKLKRN